MAKSFGLSLEELMKRPEEKQVPSILKRLFAFLNQAGMHAAMWGAKSWRGQRRIKTRESGGLRARNKRQERAGERGGKG